MSEQAWKVGDRGTIPFEVVEATKDGRCATVRFGSSSLVYTFSATQISAATPSDQEVGETADALEACLSLIDAGMWPRVHAMASRALAALRPTIPKEEETGPLLNYGGLDAIEPEDQSEPAPKVEDVVKALERIANGCNRPAEYAAQVIAALREQGAR